MVRFFYLVATVSVWVKKYRGSSVKIISYLCAQSRMIMEKVIANPEYINLAIQAIAAFATCLAVIVSLCQIKAEKKRWEKERTEKQASCIAAWFDDLNLLKKPEDEHSIFQPVVIANTSNLPIYEVVISCVGLFGAGPPSKGENLSPDSRHRAVLAQLNPGRFGLWLSTGGAGMHIVTTIEISFRDSNGISWIRRGNGTLERLEQRPFSYYRIPLPPALSHVQRLDLADSFAEDMSCSRMDD